MPRSRREEPEIRPMSLGSALRAAVRLIVWCKACKHQVEPDVAAQVERYGPELPVPEWAQRLRCSECGSRDTDFVVTGDGGHPRRPSNARSAVPNNSIPPSATASATSLR